MNFKNLTLVFVAALISYGAQGQESTDEKPTDPPSGWKLKSVFSLNITQSSFTNWAAGGRNNVSGLGFINAQANYSKDRIKWSNQLSAGLGGVQYFDDDLQKTDDVLDVQSTFSYGLKDPWFLSILGGFRTQFIDGFASPEDSLASSTFMAPGYLNLSIGIEYIPNDNLKIMASPLSGKFTFVQDQRLANAGAFGVEPAVLDVNGLILTPGENSRAEFGSYLRIIYNKELMENINLSSRLEFFSNYMNNPQNIDVNGEVILDFKVNKWFSANLQMNLIYDDDIDITDRFGNVGPRTQFKQVIGLGIAYRLANYSEKKKK
tara:strand:- start:65001 stop:65957 length:957 start_codon:yes stop_codon:yes gene_type:complete